VNIRPLIFV